MVDSKVPPDSACYYSVESSEHPAIAALRLQGAEQFDPVRFRYIQSLARRTLEREGRTRLILEMRLDDTIHAYRRLHDAARQRAETSVTELAKRRPEMMPVLRQFVDGGDFKGLARCIDDLEVNRPNSLSALRDLRTRLEALSADQSVDSVDSRLSVGIEPPPGELRSIRKHRKTWTTLSVERQLNRAVELGPINPGPLNSHMLVLRSLAAMRDLSPAYLERFVGYVDSLLWLEQTETSSPLTRKKPRTAKRKS